MKKDEVEKRILDLERLTKESEGRVEQEIRNVLACLQVLHDDQTITDRLSSGAMIRTAFACFCFVPDLPQRFQQVIARLPDQLLSIALHMLRCSGYSYADVRPVIEGMENLKVSDSPSANTADLRGSEATHIFRAGSNSNSSPASSNASGFSPPAAGFDDPRDIHYSAPSCWGPVFEDILPSHISQDFGQALAPSSPATPVVDQDIIRQYMGTMGDVAHLVFPNSSSHLPRTSYYAQPMTTLPNLYPTMVSAPPSSYPPIVVNSIPSYPLRNPLDGFPIP
ncbi:hypothetical protein BT69DRAFT_814145 [Atractiella rhizophila]|nr:hypothetical protein BT69DRAFT_814145 [Atractiella rhizophila]